MVVREMDEVVEKAKQVEAEAYLTGGQGVLAKAYLKGAQMIVAEAYLQGAQGLKPKEAWWATRKSALAWHAVGSYERPTRS